MVLGLYVTLFYPTIRDSTGLTDFLEQLPEAMLAFIGDADTYTTPEGFLNAEVFGPMAFDNSVSERAAQIARED